ncbi:hypothetical protein ABZX02_44015, partial [Lentzea sp. NPDC003310]
MTAPASRGVWRIVAAREIVVKLRDRNFVISTVITIVAIVASLAVSGFVSSRPDKIEVAVTGPETVAVVQVAGGLAAAADTDISFTAYPYPDRAAVEQQVRDGTVEVGLVPVDGGWQLIGKTAENDDATTYISAA